MSLGEIGVQIQLDDTVEHSAKTSHKIAEVDLGMFLRCPFPLFRLLVCLIDTPTWDRKDLSHAVRY